jgi:K+-sensing histidine kinase KdpD
MSKFDTEIDHSVESQLLLRAVAEELKTPLLHIVRSSELSLLSKDPLDKTLSDICQTAATALRLLDSYLLGLELADSQYHLELEPVSVSSALYDVMDELSEVAKRYQTKLELNLNSNIGLVMANASGLRAALLSMGVAFIEAQTSKTQSQTIHLTAHKRANQTFAGIYSEGSVISARELNSAYKLYGLMRQPLTQLSANSAAGIFVAKNIIQAMAGELSSVRYNKWQGLAASLQPSKQLSFI